MPKAENANTTRRRATSAPRLRTPPPPDLPESAEEAAERMALARDMRALVEMLKRQNLDRAVTLAIMARDGKLPIELQEHFGELGRRYAELVTHADVAAVKAAARPALQVIDGGAA
jgi:hypothetical protein